MINISLLVDHVKARLGVTHRQIELSDEAIVQCLLDTTLKTLSVYAPYYLIAFVNLRDNQVMSGMNTYYIPTEYGDMFDLMSVEYVLPTSGAAELANKQAADENSNFSAGHGMSNMAFSFLPGGGDLQATLSSLISMRMGMNVGTATVNPFTFDFLAPNMIRLNSPIGSGNVALILRTTHKKDFTTIPFGMIELVKDLAFYDVAMDIFSIRKYFANVRTLFAEINMDMEFYNDIPSKRSDLIDRLRKNQLKYAHTKKIYIY